MHTRLIFKHSLIKNLPVLGKEENLIIDAIRFGCEMLDFSYSSLRKDLLKMSKGDTKRSNPRTFTYAWSIIDYAMRVQKIYNKLTFEGKENYSEPLNRLIEVRNTYQHLNERIDRACIANEIAIFGTITWCYKSANQKHIEAHYLSSGNQILNHFGEHKIPPFKEDKQQLLSISLHTVINGAKGEDARIVRTDLTDVIIDVKKMVRAVEKELKQYCIDENILPMNWEKRQDIYIRLRSKEDGE
jgi:hypothetical protein